MSEAAPPTATNAREGRAREWIRTLSELPERFAGTLYEREAAERIGTWMSELGVRDVTSVVVPGGPRPGLVLALHAGLGALGCLWGGGVGAGLALLAAWSFRSEFRQRRTRLSRVFRPNDSVNVIGRAGPEVPQRRVILSAHIDTTQAGWIFRREVAARFARTNRALQRGDGQPQPPHALPEALLVAAAVVALGGWLGAHGLLLGLAQAAIVIALLVACGLGLQWAASPPTPGANDNASAVAAMLTCAHQLLEGLPADTELWLAGTGAEEVGCHGMRAFVERHRAWPPASTFYVNFECVGGGALHYIVSEGMLGKVVYPPALVELARRVAAGGAFGDVTPTHLLAGTDGHVPARHGYPTLSLISLEPSGVPRNYHRVDDTADGVDLSMVVRAADFGAAVAGAALRGEAGPIPGG